MPSTPNTPLAGKRIIIGGSSGIGLATAKGAVEQGAGVVIASRSQDKLDAAQKEIGSTVEAHTLDIADELRVIGFFDQIGAFDHLTTPGCDVWMGPLHKLELSVARASFDSKFWGQYQAAKYAAPHIREGGSIVFFSGASSQRPPPSSGAIPASMNAAVEGMARALALELAPIRVNTISPGVIDTPVYEERMTPEKRLGMFETIKKMLPVGRVGQPRDVAQAVLHLMANGYITGSIVDVGGGYALR